MKKVTFLSRIRKPDLKFIAFELGEEIPVTARTADLIDLILRCQNCDEDMVRGIICNLNDEREEAEKG